MLLVGCRAQGTVPFPQNSSSQHPRAIVDVMNNISEVWSLISQGIEMLQNPVKDPMFFRWYVTHSWDQFF